MSEDRIQALRRMVAARPEDPRPHFGLAVELLREGHTREGADVLRAYLDLTDDEGNAWRRLGAALAELGEDAEAREAYERGLKAARRHGHEAMVEELEEALEELG